MIVAVVGSRAVDLDRVRKWIRSLAAKHPGAIVVAGDGPLAQVVEQIAPRTGLRVVLLRPESRIRWVDVPRPLAFEPVDWDNPTPAEEKALQGVQAAEREYDRRVRELLQEFVVAVYEIKPGEATNARMMGTEFGSYAEAATARDTALAEVADYVAVFGECLETAFVMSEFRRLGKADAVFRIAA